MKKTQTTCKFCQSDNQRNLGGEVGIHFRGLNNLEKLRVFVFPELLVCLACGFTEFVVPETQLRKLVQTDAAGA
jgi:hypothetical protein